MKAIEYGDASTEVVSVEACHQRSKSATGSDWKGWAARRLRARCDLVMGDLRRLSQRLR